MESRKVCKKCWALFCDGTELTCIQNACRGNLKFQSFTRDGTAWLRVLTACPVVTQPPLCHCHLQLRHFCWVTGQVRSSLLSRHCLLLFWALCKTDSLSVYSENGSDKNIHMRSHLQCLNLLPLSECQEGAAALLLHLERDSPTCPRPSDPQKAH